jgi:hypothetical protein
LNGQGGEVCGSAQIPIVVFSTHLIRQQRYTVRTYALTGLGNRTTVKHIKIRWRNIGEIYEQKQVQDDKNIRYKPSNYNWCYIGSLVDAILDVLNPPK